MSQSIRHFNYLYSRLLTSLEKYIMVRIVFWYTLFMNEKLGLLYFLNCCHARHFFNKTRVHVMQKNQIFPYAKLNFPTSKKLIRKGCFLFASHSNRFIEKYVKNLF